MHPQPAGRFRSASPRAVFWGTFVLMSVISTLWALSSPPMSSPDEPAHAIKAAAVVRGQFLGDQRNQIVGAGVVSVPEMFRQAPLLPICYARQAAVPAACQPQLTGDLRSTASAVTSAVRYNPLYYVLAGLPSRVTHSELTFYLMRLVGALIAAWMVAMAARTLAELDRSFWPMSALLVSITPMVVFLSASINPQSVEIPGAVLAWTALLAMLRHPDPALLNRRMFRLSVAVVSVANVRGLGPLMLAGILLAAISFSRLADLADLLRNRRSWPYIAIWTASVAAGLLWTRFAGTLETPGTVIYPENTGPTIVRYVLNVTNDYIKQSIGIFGWLDTEMPGFTYPGAAGLLLSVILAGIAAARWRERVVMVVAGAVVLAMPIYAEYTQAGSIAHFWQGRYTLPLAVGVPLLAGFALRGVAPRDLPDWIGRRMLGTLGVAVALLQTHALTIDLRRYVNGQSDTARWWAWDSGAWLPPVNPYLLVALMPACWLALAVLAIRGANREAGRG